jgi:TRAP-type C4-dicarboxylate transport system permease small subunit
VSKALKWLDDNLEKWLIIVAYVTCAGIVAVEVFRRYVLSVQAPWSTTVPAYMFLWLAWIGMAYAVKIRAHLSFSELRLRLPRRVQYVLMQIDYVLIILLACLVIYYATDLLKLQYENASVVPGTDTIPQWWFYCATPVGWGLMIVRIVQSAVQDWRAMQTGAPLVVRGGMTVE